MYASTTNNSIGAEDSRANVAGSGLDSTVNAESPAATWEQQLREREEMGRIAFFTGDVATLSTLWAQELLVNSPLNVINDRAQVLTLLASGRIRHTVYDVTIERIHRYGDVAVVMGRDHVDGPPSGAMMERRFTNVWQLQDDMWIMIARHAQVVASKAAG